MNIIHRLTATPLARQHQQFVRSAQRRKSIRIPWDQFRRNDHPSAVLALVVEAQRALAKGEYGAVALFSQLASGLAMVGAPFDLICATTQVPADEIRHADYAIRMANLCAGEEQSFPINREAFERDYCVPMSLERLDCLMIDVAAISESLAAELIAACADGATDAVANALFRSILSDEIHHARLGWYYLAWRAPQWSLAERQRVANYVGTMVVEIERKFWFGRDVEKDLEKAARALGILDSERQRMVVHRAMEESIVPALDAAGLGASHAWKHRHRA